MTQNNMEMVAFLKEASEYFSKRDTGGEDRAFWANVYNAENCLKAAEALTSAQAEIDEQERRNDELNREISGVRRSYFEERKRAEAAEKERDALREALSRITGSAKRVDLHGNGAFHDLALPHDIDAARSLLSALQPLEPKND